MPTVELCLISRGLSFFESIILLGLVLKLQDNSLDQIKESKNVLNARVTGTLFSQLP